MRCLTLVVAVLVALWLAAGLSGCGSSTAANRMTAATAVAPARTGSGEKLVGGLRGGTLRVYDHSDFAHLDPGEAYSALDNEVVLATQRPLFSYLPDQTQTPSPDLASGPAIVSPNGRTVIVHIRHGVHFSPPVDREVTSADVAYAIERGANPNVATPYFSAYFFDIVGASKATGGPIPGLLTPDKYTIVFHLTGSYGTFFADALALPLTAPVPKEFAAPLDAKHPTLYGSTYEAATGPYMLEADHSGKFLGLGYQAGTSATLVRNPNWTPATDSRPAYLNRIDINIGGDPNVIGRQVLTGSAAIANDQLAAPIVKLAYQHYFDQLVAVPGTGLYYVALNNRRGPFANVDARRAVWAALDRTAMLKANGGAVTAQLGTHFIYPRTDGYALAGGAPGPSDNYNTHPAGDMALATTYMKAAGYPSGRYSGSATVLVVGASGDPYAGPAEIVNQALQNLGFKTRFTLVDQAVMFTKFCGTPSQEIDVCPSVGWTRDFADPQTVLDPTFAGYNIAAAGDSNFGQVNDPRINAAMRAAETVIGAPARARAWARIDRMLVDIAAAVPWAFLTNPTIESRNVRGINNLSNAGFWDYSYTSLK
jgi:peptide/nickel transport system substrate-binding protein